jgi:hypothetical protein
MVDNVNPNSQFHPYQPVNDIPAVERLKSLDALGKVREYARAKPGVVLGGLAALAIGLGMMRRKM